MYKIFLAEIIKSNFVVSLSLLDGGIVRRFSVAKWNAKLYEIAIVSPLCCSSAKMLL